jgi:hypothetical protein
VSDSDKREASCSGEKEHETQIASSVARSYVSKNLKEWTDDSVFSVFLSSIGGAVLVLNANNQIVAFNHGFFQISDRAPTDVFGLCAGEALRCVHSRESLGGCGAAKACRTCGLTSALAHVSQSGETAATKEYYLQYTRGELLLNHEFSLDVRSMMYADIALNILTLQSISERKRNQVFEKRVFHKLKNHVSTCAAAAEILGMDSPIVGKEGDLLKTIGKESGKALRAIERFRLIKSVECGTYFAALTRFGVRELWNDVAQHCGKDLRTFRFSDDDIEDEQITTDRAALFLVLESALENALEFSPQNSVVSLSSERNGLEFVLSIHNEGVIHEHVFERVFEKFYSTKKGEGHGVGTHTMRLLTERVLKGRVGFESSQEKGTTFSVRIPVSV